MKYSIEKIKEEIINIVIDAVGQEVDRKKLEIEVPPDAAMGDFAVACFYLAKLLRRSPNQIADDLHSKIHPSGNIKSVQNIGPYLNFFVNPAVFGKKVLMEIAKDKEKYGSRKPTKEKIMLEYSQPNTHKEFHIGHARNALLGSALVRLFRTVGHKVVPVSYMGDIGAHVAKCLWALEKFHQHDELPENKGKYLGKIYTEGSQKVEANPDFKKEVDEIQQKLENGDKKWLALWKKTRQWSLDEFAQIHKILDCKFDHIFYESEVEKPGKKIVQALFDKGLAEKSAGAVIINLEKYKLKNFLLLKSDGSSLYSTKELALAELKFKKYKIDKSFVVVDNRQSFYFQQYFKTMELMGFDKTMVHIPYDFVTLKDGAMSSRKGNIIVFEDFYHQILERAAAETEKRHRNWDNKKIQETGRKIALAAIKFNMLKVGNDSVIVFDVDEALSFDGFSGPYLQYTVSRINSVLKKVKPGLGGETDWAKLTGEVERELILKLAEYPEIVKDSAEIYQPSNIARYLFELAKLFSTFYQSVPILHSPLGTQKARLALVKAVKQVITNGLEILGLETMEEM